MPIILTFGPIITFYGLLLLWMGRNVKAARRLEQARMNQFPQAKR